MVHDQRWMYLRSKSEWETLTEQKDGHEFLGGEPELLEGKMSRRRPRGPREGQENGGKGRVKRGRRNGGMTVTEKSNRQRKQSMTEGRNENQS